ncbi:MAG: hypothetical protein ABSH12_01415 [Endomicrobiales bacterium]
MSVTIKEVVSKKDLNTFIRFPHELYKQNQYWVPSLDFDEKNTLSAQTNPAFDFCRAKYWLAFKDGKVVGRIAGIINDRYIEIWKKKNARFGWIDFIDDYEVSAALLDTVESWAKENGMNGLQGPLGFTDFDKEGMLVEGFDLLCNLSGVYNFPYYPEHLAKRSYAKEVDWLEFRITLTQDSYEKMDRMARIVEKRLNVKVVPLHKTKDVLAYSKEIFDLLNNCYKDIFGFVPLSDRQVAYYTKMYFSFIRPEFIQLIADSENKIVGFGFTLPLMSKALQKTKGKLFPFGFLHMLQASRKNDTAELLLIAIREDLQGKGINALIMREGYKTFVKNNITAVEASGQLETNTKVLTLWEHFKAKQHKRKRCFFKNLV